MLLRTPCWPSQSRLISFRIQLVPDRTFFWFFFSAVYVCARDRKNISQLRWQSLPSLPLRSENSRRWRIEKKQDILPVVDGCLSWYYHGMSVNYTLLSTCPKHFCVTTLLPLFYICIRRPVFGHCIRFTATYFSRPPKIVFKRTIVTHELVTEQDWKHV